MRWIIQVLLAMSGDEGIIRFTRTGENDNGVPSVGYIEYFHEDACREFASQ